MTIETKHNIGDTITYESKTGPLSGTVTDITIGVNERRTMIDYTVKLRTNRYVNVSEPIIHNQL